MTEIARALDRAIEDLPLLFRGPGGAVAVLREGAVLARHAWGYADLAGRIPFSPRTLVPVCSITKQFTCAALLEEVGDPAALDAALAARLALLHEPPPRIVDLCHNQSGLRDYWALTVLCGATPEGAFRPADAAALIGGTRSLHFPPGTQYSYSNGNFRLLSDLIEDRAGRPFGEILRRRVLEPAGMEEARLNPETGDLPGEAVGYEGNEAFGYVPAVNRIHWTGDAGLCASLDDMIAWERFIDATRQDAAGLYRRLAVAPAFADGRPARYGFGLAHLDSGGVGLTGHGGALRGWRSQRLHAAAERLSVVVLFNHAAEAREAALHLMRAALGQELASAPAAGLDAAWAGAYHDEATGLLLDLAAAGGGRLSARFATGADLLRSGPDGTAASPSMTLRRDGDIIDMERPGDNLRTRLYRVEGPVRPDIAGRFHAAELGATLTVTDAGGIMHAAFDGMLGRGPMQPLYPVAADLWRMPCQRGMDAPAPGDWTVRVARDQGGAVAGLTFGCWLARRVRFERMA
ncbi:D-aminopeptidase [Labrys wisconsinensis]|uniref:D-aminopeptidase n=1 Tax=Labrys wisconsinensis TaxID=425677 RepID=A0ABU0JG56_9HYPH|nr:D-aminopeptidase [Labrys wisconsinensis]MDQ0473277.1 D-aminopeptidase [Labrys wisconsinensis]